MRIAYDHQIFSLQKYGGISRYFVELAAHVGNDSDYAATIVAPAYLNALLRSRAGVARWGVYLPHVPGTGAMRFAFNSTVGRLRMRQCVPDVVHETYFTDEPSAPPNSATVITVFDMIHERYPDLFQTGDLTRARKRAAVQRASQVICISESTRRDLVEAIEVDPARVSVVHLAVADGFANGAKGMSLIGAPYVLYVGSRDGYKNFGRALSAFAETGLHCTGVMFICFGGAPWSALDDELVRKTGMGKGIVAHRTGGDEVLATFYRYATAFIYPSLYEGFGIPPLEAMACCCPVICSRTSSLPEVVDNAAEMFDPMDVHDIARAIVTVVGDAERCDVLRSLGCARILNFSWARCADQTKLIYAAAELDR